SSSGFMLLISATTAETWGVAMLVPAMRSQVPSSCARSQPRLRTPLALSPPGAAMSTALPALLYDARLPWESVAATATTPSNAAGMDTTLVKPSLPAAATTLTPASMARLTAISKMVLVPYPPRLMLMTSTGAIGGSPATLSPAAYSTAEITAYESSAHTRVTPSSVS